MKVGKFKPTKAKLPKNEMIIGVNAPKNSRNKVPLLKTKKLNQYDFNFTVVSINYTEDQRKISRQGIKRYKKNCKNKLTNEK